MGENGWVAPKLKRLDRLISPRDFVSVNRLLPLAVCLLLFGCSKADVDTVPEETVKKLDANTTPGAVRKWLEKSAAQHLAVTNSFELQPKDWPDWLNALTNNEPMRVRLERQNESISAVVIWNYARGIHGLDLNSETNTLPRDTKLFRSERWVPGIYAWRARND
jgi:hypothetical protein